MEVYCRMLKEMDINSKFNLTVALGTRWWKSPVASDTPYRRGVSSSFYYYTLVNMHATKNFITRSL